MSVLGLDEGIPVEVDKLGQIILKIQSEIGSLTKDSENPHFRSKYLSLEALVEALQPIFTKYGLIWMAFPSISAGQQPALRYCLTHVATGETVGDSMPLLLDRNNAQGLGSAITYARRYALCSVLNIIADEDDDGNKASPKTRAKDDFATQVRATGMKANEIKLWLGTEGGYDTAQLPSGAAFAEFLNELDVSTQAILLAWAKGES